MYHTMKNGKEIPIADMDDNHLINTIKWIERKAKNGFNYYFGGGWDSDSFWGDFIEFKGVSALKELNYNNYLKEALKRDLITQKEFLLKQTK